MIKYLFEKRSNLVLIIFYFFISLFGAALDLFLVLTVEKYISLLSTDFFERSEIIPIFICCIILVIAIFVFSILSCKYVLFLGWKITNSIKEKLILRILTYNSLFYLKYSVSELIAILENDTQKIFNTFVNSIFKIFANVLNFLVIAIYLCLENIYVGIIFVVYSFLAFSVLLYRRKKNKFQNVPTIKREFDLEITKRVEEINSSAKDLVALDCFDEIERVFSTKVENGKKIYTNFQKYSYYLWILSLTVYTIFSFISLLASGALYILGICSFGIIYLIYTYNSKFKSIFEELPYNLSLLEISKVSLEKINLILSYEEQIIEEKEKPLTIEKIQINSLHYCIDDKKILENISVCFKKSDSYYIYGDSGDGKSTLLKLIVKELPLEKDTIKLNDISINDIDDKVLRNLVFYLTNNVELFSGSILYNLKLDDNPVSEEEKELLEKIDLLNTLNCKSYNDVLDIENLTDIQKQLIGLARCFFVKKELVILDEANSKLPLKSNETIINLIKSQNPEAIFILVSHNSEMKKFCNHTIKIEKGRVVEYE